VKAVLINQWPKLTNVTLARAALVLVSLVSSVVAGLIVVAARFLRPIADDYCLAFVADQGVIGGINHWFQTWSGSLTQVTLNNVIVGLPGRHAPWELVSAVPFILTTFVVSAVAVQLVGGIRLLKGSILGAWALSSVCVCLWWSSWWLPVILSGGQTSRSRAVAITVWQNINSAYVLLVALSIALWLIAIRESSNKSVSRRFPFGVYLAGLGIWTGFADAPFALSTIAVIGIVIVLAGPESTVRRQLWPWPYILFVTAVILSSAVSLNSPGTRSRTAGFAEIRPLETIDAPSLLAWMVPSGLKDWAVTSLSSGVLFAGFGAVLLGILLNLSSVQLPSQRWLFGIAASLGLFSLVYGLASQAAQAFAYSAFWHQIGPGTAAFFAWFVGGIAVGDKFSSAQPKRVVLATVAIIAAIALTLSWFSISAMRQEIWNRFPLWVAGAAPTDGIGDIESDWVNECWVSLGQVRETPYRSPG